MSSFFVVDCKSFKQELGINKLQEVLTEYSFQSYSSKDFAVLPQVNCISGMIFTFYKNFEKISGLQNFDASTTLKLVSE